jgi:hypothetical protein
VRVFRHGVLLLPIALVVACSDAPTTPVTPRVTAASPSDFLAPVVTVTNTDDAGPGSLRQAVIDAPDGAVVRFDAPIAGQTIVLTTGQIAIPKSLTIEGPVPTGMTISGNLSSRVFRVDQDVDVTLRNLAIVNGRSVSDGGGVLNEGILTLDHSLIANNEALVDGGGLGLVIAATRATILNSTITGNISGRHGGAISANRTTIIRNSTIAENTSPDGGGISVFASVLNVRNSIIANNIDNDPTNSTQPNCSLDGNVPVLTGTNLSNDDSCGTGASMIIANPRLGPIARNGGPTKTLALLLGSPAIDGGTACSEETDQRYVARPQGVTCDIGAFELDRFASVTLTIAPNVAVNEQTGAATVTGTATCSAQATIGIDVSLSQAQKVKGKPSTIVQAAGATSINCVGTTAWSATLTPSNGAFEKGDVTGTVNAGGAFGFLPATVTSTLKAFTVR